MLFDNERMRGKKIYRMLLIIPYALPTFMTILVWRDMLNESIRHHQPDPAVRRPLAHQANWAKFSVLLVNLWLGYAFMFLVNTGALQGIPGDLKEAAFVDGATGFNAFRRHHLPAAAGRGGAAADRLVRLQLQQLQRSSTCSPTAARPSPDRIAGETDIMITYTYRVAFGGAGSPATASRRPSRCSSSSIVAVISIIGFRYTRSFEEVQLMAMQPPGGQQGIVAVAEVEQGVLAPAPPTGRWVRGPQRHPSLAGCSASATRGWRHLVAPRRPGLRPVPGLLWWSRPRSTRSAPSAQSQLIPSEVSLENFSTLFDDQPFWTWFRNTMVIGLATGFCHRASGGLRGLRLLPLPVQGPAGRAA